MRRWGALVIVLLVGCSGEEGQDPTIIVPSTWKEVRRGTGHVAHLREDVKCKDCHAVEGSGFHKPSLIVCASCHETVLDRTHRSEKGPNGDCYACHDFREKTEVGKGNCMRCHEKERTPQIHAKEDCLACHSPHKDPPIVIASCTRCHEEQKAFIHTGMKGVDGCRACHQGHAKKEAALKTCLGCHEDKEGAHNQGHRECTTCHTPHRPMPTCQSCHQNVRKDRHEKCSGCHQPHSIQTKAAESCGNCHADVLVDHGAGEASCTTCHVPHQPIQRCSRCHTISPTDTALHAGNIRCVQCHQPHQLVLDRVQGESCGQACHPQQNAAVIEPHQGCTNCHLTAPHFPKRPPGSCGRCHAEEQRSAPHGHDQCVRCHEPHSGRIQAGKTCQSCHQKPDNIHTPAGDCETCHAPHGPERKVSPPSCVSCHSSLPELHRDPGHAHCVGCHQPHEKEPRRDRDLCDRCHTLPDHEPKVSTCVGCHPFR